MRDPGSNALSGAEAMVRLLEAHAPVSEWIA